MQLILSFLEYLKLEKNYSSHTVMAYQKDITSFAVFCKELDTTIVVANYKDIRKWIVKLSQEKLSPRAINRKISALNSFYKYLQKIKERTANPLARHKVLKVPKKVQIPFSQKEIKKVLEQGESRDDFETLRDITMIKLLYSTGIRRAELIELKVKDIDFVKKQLKVLGKRNKERIVPLLETMIEQLHNYMAVRTELVKDCDCLFITKKGKKVYPTLVYRVINTYFSPVSTKVKKSPHILRHSFATQLIGEGADLNGVKELLGHASLASTQVYTHNDIKKLKDTYKKSHPRNK